MWVPLLMCHLVQCLHLLSVISADGTANLAAGNELTSEGETEQNGSKFYQKKPLPRAHVMLPVCFHLSHGKSQALCARSG